MNQLFILAFDHRSSLLKIFPREEIPKLKKIIYEGFKRGVGEGMVPKNEAAILVDEEFGQEILVDAKAAGYQICLPVEKSGVENFEFEYGKNFSAHINKFQPDYVKAAIRNIRDRNGLENLSLLSKYCRPHGYKFILEALVDKVTEIIPKIYSRGIEPDLWKLKGFTELNSVREVVRTVRANGRKHVGMLILGRGEDQDTLDNWLRVGREVEGVIGFAIGRTIFMPPLLDFKDGKIDKDQAAALISRRYKHFYHVFNS